MQSIVRKAVRPFTVVLKGIILSLIICATGGAWATTPTPVVVWDGASSDYDFNELTRSGYTINPAVSSITASTIGGDGAYIQIGNGDGIAGVSITNPTVGTFGNGGTTVIIRYSDLIKLASNRALIALMDDDEFSDDSYDSSKKNHAKVGLGQSNGSYGEAVFIKGGGVDTYLKGSFAEGMQTLAFVCNSSQMAFYVNGNYRTNLAHSYGSITPTGIMLGGLDVDNSGKFYALKNLKIYAVAIFDRELTAEEIAAYKFPASDSGTPAKWQYANYMLTWQTPDTATTGNMSVDTSIFQYYDNYLNQEKTTTVPGGTAWPWFCYGQQLRNPGVVLRLKNGSYYKTLGGNFDNCTFAGLKVESDASGYKIEQTDASKRGTRLGDVSGNAETWFEIGSSFSIKRTGSFYLSGIVNIDIADGAVLSLNDGIENITNGSASHYPAICASVDSSVVSGGALKMHGEGQLKTTKLTATGSYLDYSTLNGRENTNPFIDATLVVDEKTTYAFPADVAGGSSYRLATALDGSDATRDTVFSVGSHTYTAPLTFNASSGTVNFPAVATVAEGDLTSPKLWSAITWDAKPATIDNTTPVVINVDDDTYLASTTALSLGSLTFNIAEGKTLLFVPSQGLTTANGFTVTGGGTLKIAMNTSITGDMTIADDVTLAYYAESDRLTVNGALTVASGKTLTLAPVAISEATATLVTATTLTVDGTLAVAAPDSDNTYNTATTANSVILKRTPNPAFSYSNSISGGAPSGWGISSWSSDTTVDNLRVGPSATMPIVREITTSFHPGNAVTLGGDSFSFSVYADVSQINVVTDKNYVLASIGRGAGDGGNKFVALYRRNDKIMLGNFVDGDWNISPIEVDVPSGGFHLYTAVCGSDGTLALYRDAGTGSGESATRSGGNPLSIAASTYAGLQLGNIWVGNGNFLNGTGIALAAAIGFDKPLTAAEVANLAEGFPATDGLSAPSTIDNRLTDSSTCGSAIKLYSVNTTDGFTIPDGNYLGISQGTMTIPSGHLVKAPMLKTLNTNQNGNSITVSIAGELDVTGATTSHDVWSNIAQNKGILLGHWAGSGTYNITGSLIARDSYMEAVYTAASQIINVNGGTMAVKGYWAAKANTVTINLTNGGVIEVKDVLTAGEAPTQNFGYGTFKLATATNGDREIAFPINFTGTSDEPTTLDPYGHTLTVGDEKMTGTGYVTVSDSSGNNGTVKFVGSSSFGGRIILTDANSARIDISDFTGTVECRGTAAATLEKLNGFAGTVYFTESVDASEINLSGATVNVAADCTYTAIVGQEGTMVLASGATAKLMVTTEVSNYEGHVPSVSGAGSVGYWLSDGEQTQLTGEDHLNGNNLLPYYYVWTPSETASENTISANAAARWKVRSLPTANKNVAFKISGATTVLVDATVTYGEVQVYGTGTLTFQSADGAAAMTVVKKLQTTSTTAVQIDSGIEFGANAELEVVSTSDAYMTAVNCGTEAAPYEIPAITGGGIAYVAEGKYLTTAKINAGTFYALGNATVTNSAAIGTLQVQPTGVLTLDSAAVAVSGTATISGTVNVDATSTFIPTAVSDAGSVVWTGKQPDCTKSDSSVWCQSTWSGTNIVINVGVYDTQIYPQYWGRNGSYIRVTKVMGYIANNATVNAELILDDGEYTTAFQPANGASNDNAVKLRKISGAGTLRDANNNATMHYVIRNATDYSGSIDLSTGSPSRTYVFSSASTTYPSRTTYKGCIYVNSDGYAKIGDGKSWKVASDRGVYILGEVELEGAGSISGPVTVSGTSAKLTLANSALSLNSALTLSEGYALEIDPGEITLSTTPVALITGLTNADALDVSGITVENCTVTVGGESGAYTICAAYKNTAWSGVSGDWTEASFNGGSLETDGEDVSFVAGASGAVAVTLTGTRAPANVVFNGGSTSTYTLTGGTFSPSGTVTVESGTVTIESAATGTYVVDAGATLSLTNATVTSVSGTGTLNIPEGGVVTISAGNAISVGKLTGTGTLVVGANIPSSTLQSLLKATAGEHWEGTLAFGGLTANTDTQNFNFSNYGNVDSKIQFTNCTISYLDGDSSNFAGELVLCDDASHNPAFATANGYSDKANDVGKLSGNGSISATANPLQIYRFHSASDFTGSITVTPSSYDSSNKKYSGRRIVFGTSPATVDNKSKPSSITVDSGVEAGLGEGATWNAAFGIYVSGTLIVHGDSALISNGTLTDHTDAVNIPEDKHIVFYDNATLKYKKLATVTMTGDVTLASDSTVNIAFGDGVDTSDLAGTKLISWSGAPEGDFEFADVTTPKCYRLEKRENGLYLVVKPGTIFSVY